MWFPEGTWILILPMKWGIIDVAIWAGAQIVPTVLNYDRETMICSVRFGIPMAPDSTSNLSRVDMHRVVIQGLEAVDGVHSVFGRRSQHGRGQGDALPDAQCRQPLPQPALLLFLNGEPKQLVKFAHFNHHADRYAVGTNRDGRVQTSGRLSYKIKMRGEANYNARWRKS